MTKTGDPLAGGGMIPEWSSLFMPAGLYRFFFSAAE